MRKRPFLLAAAALAAVIIAIAMWPRAPHTPPAEAEALLTAPEPSPTPAPTTVSTSDHAEVFRRAFWRTPTAADRILHAERRVNPDDQSWQWFIQLHPSNELLSSLRDPHNLGLLALPPGEAPRPWPTAPEPPPDWFPAHDSLVADNFEIRQSPASGLTLLYRAHDNTLFATDHGSGFTPPVR